MSCDIRRFILFEWYGDYRAVRFKIRRLDRRLAARVP